MILRYRGGKPFAALYRKGLRKALDNEKRGRIPAFRNAILLTLGADRIRTDGLVRARDALFQLSYCPDERGLYTKCF